MTNIGEHHLVLSSLETHEDDAQVWKILKKLRLDTDATNADIVPLHGLLSAPSRYFAEGWNHQPVYITE